MAKRKDDKTPFGDDYQKIIDNFNRERELGVDESGERVKRPPKVTPNKSGNAAKRASTKMRAAGKDKRTARQSALKKWREQFKRTGKIPASPTR